ncbi:hypothetical protein FGE12_13560 [Aggregicoccus sp. 17bor-14]|uniref:hypothetical protein n=1 Tax=Myxococcaceae TaxID=31 RepID=UPI00129C9E8B|nr:MULTISPECIES: hypothetical protein [Myxococcaceae]MBF5043419.1 hypothetical protein [Simulacricoccus sp. 17bor-14]MRI89177.1 hypothetical protein [Aggregicoccus sp. 17bor-14]
MDILIFVGGAVAFTALTMLLGPWMWSSNWHNWRMFRDKNAPPPPPPGPEHARQPPLPPRDSRPPDSAPRE